MTETAAPYDDEAPGNILTAAAWNAMQRKIYDDIRATSQAAAAGVTHVATADDAAALDGKGLTALIDEITKRVLDDVRERTGYQQLYKVLHADEPTVIEHKLGTAPLVDVYQLEYFEVACREDDETRASFATFYLFNAEERRVRVPTADGTGRRAVDIQPPDGPELGIPFKDMLARYHVAYTDTRDLDDLETEFWQAFFKAPNDRFNDDQYCHSPWFERCCKEQQSVRQLKDKGDWDDIMFMVQPRKTVNFVPPAEANGEPTKDMRHARPTNVAVQHLDNDRVALWFRPPTPHDAAGTVEGRAREYINDPDGPVRDPDVVLDEGPAGRFERELKVMVLLKV